MRTADTMIRSHVAEWEELEFLMARRSLTRPEVERLGVLYRHCVSHLACARRDFPEDRVTSYLQGLVARAHPRVFRRPRRLVSGLAHLLAVEFPAAVRSLRWECALAALLFFGSGLVTGLLAAGDPREYTEHLNAGAERQLVQAGEDYRRDGHADWVTIDAGQAAGFSSFIASNNIFVAALALAGGATAGLLTLVILLSNGWSLGLTFGLAPHFDAIVPLLTFVSAHGPVELSIIVIAAAAGFGIARAMLLPGERRWGAAVVDAARRAMIVVIGGSAALILAGIIEGCISPFDLPLAAKLSVGGVSGLLLWAYICVSPKPSEEDPEALRGR